MRCHMVFAVSFCATAAFAAIAKPARADKVAIAQLENAASLSPEEVGVLTGAVTTALTDKSFKLEAMFMEPPPGVACDSACASKNARARGARYLVSGRITLFDEQYTAQLEAIDLSKGTIVASKTTQPAKTLIETLSLTRKAAEEICKALVAQTTPPPPVPTVAARPVGATGAWDQSRNGSYDMPPPGLTMAALQITTYPLGAKVWLGHSMVYAGTSPLYKLMPPGGTRVTIVMDGYHPIEKLAVRLFAGETKHLDITLRKRDLLAEKSKRYLTAGITMLVFGAPTIVLGTVMASAVSIPFGAIFAAIGGTLVVTGLTLLILRGKTRRELKKRKSKLLVDDLAVLPSHDGVAFGWGRAF